MHDVTKLYISSSVTGTRFHVCFLTLPLNDGVVSTAMTLMQDYNLPYLQIWEHDSKVFLACLKPLDRARYRKILHSVDSPSLAEFEKYGHVLFPMGATYCKTLPNNAITEEQLQSKTHYHAWTKLSHPVSASNRLVGRSQPKIFVRSV